jgi:hypothetical protein
MCCADDVDTRLAGLLVALRDAEVTRGAAANHVVAGIQGAGFAGHGSGAEVVHRLAARVPAHRTVVGLQLVDLESRPDLPVLSAWYGTARSVGGRPTSAMPRFRAVSGSESLIRPMNSVTTE